MIRTIVVSSMRQATIGTLALLVSFVMVEPAVSQAFQTSVASTFTISQTVGAEVAFVTTPSNVTMSPVLGGITGGTANGQTQFVINTNDIAGYNLTLFASSSGAMVGIASSSNSIPAYIPSTLTVPDLNFANPANAARFGYTIAASTTADNVQLFKNSGAACNTGALTNSATSNASLNCWLNASSTPVTIINRTMPVFNGYGATSTLYFRVWIGANPNPVIPNDTYVATTTITATAN